MSNSPAECRRVDLSLATVVDVGVAYNQSVGYPTAKVYLIENGVRKDIIQRVLTVPDRRRGQSHNNSQS
ncbi:MAG TPA: hypothetical protein VGC21_17965 [Telluria sp.]|jgi:hypothetical protein